MKRDNSLPGPCGPFKPTYQDSPEKRLVKRGATGTGTCYNRNRSKKKMLIKLKWGKNDYDVQLDEHAGVRAFKTLVQDLTGVSCDRQKLMCKAWKGVLKDDALWGSMPDLKDGVAMSLSETNEVDSSELVINRIFFRMRSSVGSADTVVKPAAPVVFVEDMPKGAAAAAGKGLPVGSRKHWEYVLSEQCVPTCYRIA